MHVSAARPTSILKSARVSIATLFFINGMIVATWAARIPAIKHALGLSQAALGLALLGGALGALVAMNIAGYVAARVGSRPVATLTTLALCGTLPLLALAPNPVLLFGALFLFGASIGSMDVSMNVQGVAAEKGYGRPILSSFHAMFSVGGLLGALAGGLAAAVGWNPALDFGVVAIVAVILGVISVPGLMPSNADSGGAGVALALPSRALLAVGLVAFCTVVAEGAMTDWTALYLNMTAGAGVGVAALGFAAFSLSMATSRFAGDRLNLRFGPVSLVRVGALIAACGVILALAAPLPVPAIVGFGLTGIGLASIFPIAISAAGRSRDMPVGTAVASVATWGYFGFLAGPPTIGFIAQATSLRLALGVVVALCLLAALLATAVAPAGQRLEEQEIVAAVEPW